MSDSRTAHEVERDLKALGLEPVWKNWDRSFDVETGSGAAGYAVRP